MNRWLNSFFFACFCVLVFWGVIDLGYSFISEPITQGRLILKNSSSVDEALLQRAPSEVDLSRDERGVTLIKANTALDAYWALGFAHAQDRLWQMEFSRRVARGRLSEVVGVKGLPVDRLMRTFGFVQLAKTQYDRFKQTNPNLVQALQHYADGVNIAIAQSRQARPFELIALGVEPEPWQPEDSVLISYLLALDLSANLDKELIRFRFASVLNSKQFSEFFPPYPDEKPLVDLNLSQFYQEQGLVPHRPASAAIDMMRLERERRDPFGRSSDASTEEEMFVPSSGATSSMKEGIELANQLGFPFDLGAKRGDGIGSALGSNGWVVSGRYVQTKYPLLANDPHFKITSPSIWYMATLQAPGLSVVGGTIAGLPFVVIGRNNHLAWGFTNSGADVQDIYLERLNRSGRAYQTKSGWENVIEKKETILVKGQQPEILTVRSTKHGPIISGVLPLAEQAMAAWRSSDTKNSFQYALSLSWTLWDQNDSLAAGLGMNTATDWSSFKDAALKLDVPVQNILYADTQGHIAWLLPGRIPKRVETNPLMGWVPSPGWDSTYDWQGVQPVDKTPALFDVDRAWLVSANGKMQGVSYPYFVTADWALPYRQERATELLEKLVVQNKKVSVADQEMIQMDSYSQMFTRLIPVWKTWSAREVKDEKTRRILEAMQRWDGKMDANDWRPLVAVFWFREWARRVFQDDLGLSIYREYASPATMFWPLWHVIQRKDMTWCDDVRTVQQESCEAQMKGALTDALVILKDTYGANELNWSWGKVHRLWTEHRLFSSSPMLASSFEYEAPMGGDSYSIQVSNYAFTGEHSFQTFQTAGMRVVYDLSQPDLSGAFFTWPLANSALARSWRQHKQLNDWVNGVYEPIIVEDQGALFLRRLVIKKKETDH
jgi:penicillin amidase